jgi:hypothetical protein
VELALQRLGAISARESRPQNDDAVQRLPRMG